MYLKQWRYMSVLLASLIVSGMVLTACSSRPQQQAAQPQPSQEQTKPAPAAEQQQTKPAPAAEQQQPKPAAPKPLRLTKFGASSKESISWLPMYFGMKKGIYAEQGLNVEWNVVKANVGITALTTGDIDFVGFWGSTIRAASQGAPVRAVLAAIEKPLQFLLVKPEIKEIQDLRGKTLGSTTLGASADLLLRKALAKKGLDAEKDVKVIALGEPVSQVAGLKQGMVDGVNVAPPLSFDLQQEGFNNLLFFGDVLVAPFAGVNASVDRIAKEPDFVKAMLRGTLLSMQYIRQHKQELITFIVEEYKVDPKIAEDTYGWLVKTLSKDGLTTDEGILFDASPGTKPENVVDFSLLKQVIKELGL